MNRGGSLRRGDVVEVLSAAEILATLDDDASYEAMPFMPEMLAHAGKRYTVAHRVEKICDTAQKTYTSRRMRNTVFLDDLRCDGSAHEGCQAACRLYWKEAWLRRVDDETPSATRDTEGAMELEARAAAATRSTRDLEGVPNDVFRCQATEATAASEPIGNYDLRQYVREIRVGNVSVLHVVRVLSRAAWSKILRFARLRGDLALEPRPSASSAGSRPLQLVTGDLARVRSRDEIAATLDDRGKTRGLMYDAEMVPHCGRTYQVQDRIERFIDEGTGEMIEISSDCVVLQGVVCSGDHSVWRWFCQRQIYPWWREAWLERAEDATARRESSR